MNTSGLTLEEELFAIPRETAGQKYFFLYAPLKGTVLKVNGGTIGLLKKVKRGMELDDSDQPTIDTLLKYKILSVPKEENQKTKGHNHSSCNCNEEYKPTSLTLLPTFNCNLACRYCYSLGGEDVGSIMDIDIAKAAVDWIIKNALEAKQKSHSRRKQQVSLGFHGGGEPLLHSNIAFLREIRDYFNYHSMRNDLKYSVSSATNGVLSPNDLEWAVFNLTHLNISLDGLEDIQNKQRPKRGPNQTFLPSYDEVVSTIRYLEERKFSYGIRATITQESVQRMPEILEFFHSISSNKSFHLEPLFECGRCLTTNAKAPDPEEFLKYILATKELASKLGVEVYYSGAKLGEVGDHFCGAAGKNFFVTPTGSITTCLEVCRDTDPHADIFMVGKYSPKTKSFEIYEDRIQKLKDRTVKNMPKCADCFAKYNCKGDCLAKVLEQSGDLYDTENNVRCHINQGLLLDEIEKRCVGEIK